MSKIFSQYKSTRRKICQILSQQKRELSLPIRETKSTPQRKRALKTAIKKYNAAIEAGDVALAEQLLPETVSVIDCAFKDGIYKKNTVARKKSTLCRALDALKANK